MFPFKYYEPIKCVVRLRAKCQIGQDYVFAGINLVMDGYI